MSRSDKVLRIIIVALVVVLIFAIIKLATCGSAVTDSRGEEFGLSFTEYEPTGDYRVIVDNRTGVCYLQYLCGYQAGITPLLKADGTPLLERERSEYLNDMG